MKYSFYSFAKFYVRVVWVCLLVVAMGCTDDTPGENNSSADVSDADTTTDTRRDTDVQDTTSDSDTTAAPDTRRDTDTDTTDPEWVDCNCPRADDVCRAGEGTCADISVDCGDGEACPDGYECREVSDARDGQVVPLGEFCVCVGDAAACRPSCQADADCPAETACDQPRGPGEGTCNTDISPCAGNYDCLPDQICERSDRIGESICMDTGDKTAGEACDADIECASAACDDGTCTDYCLVDADCSAGEVCQGTGAWDGTDGCVEAECPTTCPQDSVCNVRDETCDPAFCRLTDDCDDGDCVIFPADPQMGRCQTADAPDTTHHCKPNEFRIWDDDPYCRLTVPCEFGADECPSGYECLSVVDQFPNVATLYCSRRVVEP